MDPKFVDTDVDNYQLQANSPLINAGDPTSTTASVATIDLAGNKRIDSGRIDMGAYEFQINVDSEEFTTVRSGSWADPSTWSNNRVPMANDIVYLRHGVNIPENYVAHAHKLIYGFAVKLLWGEGAKLVLN